MILEYVHDEDFLERLSMIFINRTSKLLLHKILESILFHKLT